MPIVDISGFAETEYEAKKKIRRRIQEFYHKRLDMPLDATAVTFITDDTDGSYAHRTPVHVMARLYSKKFMGMEEEELNEICDGIVLILEEEGGHTFNEAFPIPVLAMRGGTKPYNP